MIREFKTRLSIVALTSALLGCTSQGPDVKTGDCITPVDGMQIYKVTRVVDGTIYAHTNYETADSAASKEAPIPKNMRYVDVDCPI